MQFTALTCAHCAADFTSLLPKGDKIYTVTHFESPEPMASYFTKSTQDPATGKLTVDSTECVACVHYLVICHSDVTSSFDVTHKAAR